MNINFKPKSITYYPDGCPNSSTHIIDRSVRYNDCNRTQLCTTCGIVDASLRNDTYTDNVSTNQNSKPINTKRQKQH